jgi:hypothetical protein
MSLDDLGLRRGDRVRFQRAEGGRWHEATVVGRERDGSVALFDTRGAARSIGPERLEVRARGPRGAPVWEPVLTRAGRAEQLTFIDELAGELASPDASVRHRPPRRRS